MCLRFLTAYRGFAFLGGWSIFEWNATCQLILFVNVILQFTDSII